MSDLEIPELNKKFFCIVHRDNPVMAALISSYAHKEGEYLPLFEYSDVTISRDETDMDEFDENYISKHYADEFNIRIRNALSAVRGCDYLILGGLSEDQKSYLTLDEYNVIDIDKIGSVDIMLKDISEKVDYFVCKKEDIHYGLYIASKTNSLLKIDNNAPSIPSIEYDGEQGLIIIEEINATSTVIAVNYAISINSAIKIIQSPQIDKKEIRGLIEAWKTENNDKYYYDLSALLYDKVEDIDFRLYEYATFFTFGAPYSLILNNIIPFTYVNNQLNPDFFIFNNLFIEKRNPFFSSIVFSPVEFDDEETSFVSAKLVENQYYVKELFGKNASVANLDNHIKEFPYEVLHICSHGGEVDGTEMKEEFTDRNGDIHIVEFDEIVSFAPEKGEELIGVIQILIWRKFDGMVWKSRELKNKNYPRYVFIDMQNELFNNRSKNGKKKTNISGSSHIKCSDFNYHASFNLIAGLHSTPFIFNNTCWSWSDISESFLSVGIKGYIGTLWAVNNNTAKKAAEIFYEEVFGGTILNALQKSLSQTVGTKDENVYMLWGLHFSRLKQGHSIDESRMKVADKLLSSFFREKERIKNITNKEIQEHIQRLINFNFNQLIDYFLLEFVCLKKRIGFSNKANPKVED